MNARNPEQAVIAPVRHRVVVNAPVERAFTVFTDGFGTWWPKSHTISAAPVERHGSTGAAVADGVRDGWAMPLEAFATVIDSGPDARPAASPR